MSIEREVTAEAAAEQEEEVELTSEARRESLGEALLQQPEATTCKPERVVCLNRTAGAETVLDRELDEA